MFAPSAEDGSVTGGWLLNRLNAVDLAGGTAVHSNSDIEWLAAVTALGTRRGWPRQQRRHPVRMVRIRGVGRHRVRP